MRDKARLLARVIDEDSEQSRFGTSRRSSLPGSCRACGHSNRAGSNFCANCGARVTIKGLTTRVASTPSPSTSLEAVERRQVTIMFCDLVGSTALSAGLDPEDFRALIAAYYRDVTAEVQHFGGSVARLIGDGVLVCFGYPAAHEDDAERAVRAGLAVIAAIHKLKVHPDIVLNARIGIATGLVVVSTIGEGPGQEWTVLGDTPNLAARLQTIAAPGTVVIAPTTHRLVGERFECDTLGSQEIKGIASPLEVWQVLGASHVTNRSWARLAAHTPMVGRVDEMELLLRHWKQVKTGQGHVVLLSGEPGIGKSRLARAFEERIGNEPHARMRYFGSALHQDSAFFPIISQLEHAAGIDRQDSADSRLDKLAALLERHSADSREQIALLAELLGIAGSEHYPARDLSPGIRMERTLAVLLSRLVSLSERQPLVIIFEDAHWFDHSSNEVLHRVIKRLQTLPILLVITARPEFQPQWINLPQVTLQTLNPLSRHERTSLIEHLTGDKPLPEQVLQQIVERTDGVPLFVEELTKTVVELEFLRDQADHCAVCGQVPEIALPASLQGSLVARLDRLGGAVREIAQEAAAIGREFPYELLAAVTERNEKELVNGLDRLVEADLVQQGGLPPEASYSFKHTLVQDAAYSMLLRTKRKALHARIAEAYDQQFRDLIDMKPEVMAHHLAYAGLAERSIGFRLKAARIAIARGAAAEAVAQLYCALALLNDVSDYDERRRQELELQIALGNALAAATGYTGMETDAAFRRARELCLKVGDTDQLIRVVWGQFTGHFAGGRQRPALAVANELLELSERLDNDSGRQMGHASIGAGLVHLACFAKARTHFELGLAIDTASERESTHLYGQSGRLVALSYMSLDAVLTGSFNAAQRLAKRCVEEARKLAHPTSLCFTHSILCRVYYLLGDMKALAWHSAMVVRLAEEHGLSLWRGLGIIYTGWSRAAKGAPDEGIAMIRDGIAQYRAVGAALSLPLYLASLADLERAAGNAQEALKLLGEAQAVAKAGDEHWVSAEIHRLIGEAILAGKGDAADAEREYRAALALARRQGARLWEARAQTSLERLSRYQSSRTISGTVRAQALSLHHARSKGELKSSSGRG
jgi:class 3 adenylate cyclase/ABC-type transport system involved in cytochrome c biogenesis ATPase subunit